MSEDNLEPLSITQLEPDLWQLQLWFVHAFLIHDDHDGWILIDSGYPVKPGHPNMVVRALDQLGLKTTDITQILITHGHPDHIGNVALVAAQSHAPIWMGAADAGILEKSFPMPPVHQYDGSPGKGCPYFEPAPVTHRIHGDTQIPLAGSITAIETPGHSAGQVAYLWNRHNGILFAADNLINENDELAIAPGNIDFNQVRHSLEKLSYYEFDKLLVSHGNDLLANASFIYRNLWLPNLIPQTLNSVDSKNYQPQSANVS